MKSPAVALAIPLLVASVTNVSCLPTVQNLTKRNRLSPTVVQCLGLEDSVLVLPVWFDNGADHIRDPLILPTTELERLSENMEPRRRLGLDGLDGHGPSHSRSINGFLLVSDKGRILWLEQSDVAHEEGELTFYWRPDQVASLTSARLNDLVIRIQGNIPPPGDVIPIPRPYSTFEELIAVGLSAETQQRVIAFLKASQVDSPSGATEWDPCSERSSE